MLATEVSWQWTLMWCLDFVRWLFHCKFPGSNTCIPSSLHLTIECDVKPKFLTLGQDSRHPPQAVHVWTTNPLNPSRKVYFCHQNQNAKYIGNFTTLLKPHNIGTRYSFERYWDTLSGGTIIFYILPLLGELYHFLEFSQNNFSLYKGLKPHCIQSSRVLVPAGTSKSRHGIQAVTSVMAYVADAVTLWCCLQQCALAALN
jgi:hypothetical protein